MGKSEVLKSSLDCEMRQRGITTISQPDPLKEPQLEVLNLAMNNFGLKALKYVCKMLASDAVHLRVLNLKGNRLNFEGCYILAQTLLLGKYDLKLLLQNPGGLHELPIGEEGLPYLQQLNLSQTGINDDGFLCLSFAIAALPDISSVNLSDNYIGDRGGQLG